MFADRMKRNNIELTLVASPGTTTNMHISPDEIAVEFVPLSNELL
jgi:hypothetical protein